MSQYTLQQEEIQILQFILAQFRPTTEDILKALYLGDESKKWHVYRKMQKLQKGDFIKAMPLDEMKGAYGPKCFVLRVKGARALGLEKVPPSHYRPHVTKDYRTFYQIKVHLSSLAQKHRWILLAENQQCRQVIAQFLRSIAIQKGVTPAPDYVYLDLVPQTISPDMVLKTAREVIIIIVPYPTARIEVFRKRLEMYGSVIYNLRFIVINPLEKQTRDFQKELERQEHIAARGYKQQFLIISSHQIESIQSWLRA